MAKLKRPQVTDYSPLATWLDSLASETFTPAELAWFRAPLVGAHTR